MLALLFAASLMNCGTPQTLHPTAHTVDEGNGGTITNPTNAYDKDEGTLAQIAATGSESFGSLNLNGFTNDCFASNRSLVKIRFLSREAAWGDDDWMRVYFKADPSDAWTKVALYAKGDIGIGAAEWIEIDVTDYALTDQASGFGVSFQFGLGRDGDPPKPGES